MDDVDLEMPLRHEKGAKFKACRMPTEALFFRTGRLPYLS